MSSVSFRFLPACAAHAAWLVVAPGGVSRAGSSVFQASGRLRRHGIGAAPIGGIRFRRQRLVDPQFAGRRACERSARRWPQSWRRRSRSDLPAGELAVGAHVEHQLGRVLGDFFGDRGRPRWADRPFAPWPRLRSPWPWSILHDDVGGFPLSQSAAARKSNATNGSATSSVGHLRSHGTAPSPTVASPSATIFQLADFCATVGRQRNTGLRSDLRESRSSRTNRRPAGCRASQTEIGAVKPSLRLATIFRFIEPFAHQRATFGSTISIRDGGFVGHRRRRAVRLYWFQTSMLFWPSRTARCSLAQMPSTLHVGIDRTANHVNQRRPAGASGAAVEQHRHVARGAPIGSVSTVTPAAGLRTPGSGRRQSAARAAVIIKAMRLPLATGATMSMYWLPLVQPQGQQRLDRRRPPRDRHSWDHPASR